MSAAAPASGAACSSPAVHAAAPGATRADGGSGASAKRAGASASASASSSSLGWGRMRACGEVGSASHSSGYGGGWTGQRKECARQATRALTGYERRTLLSRVVVRARAGARDECACVSASNKARPVCVCGDHKHEPATPSRPLAARALSLVVVRRRSSSFVAARRRSSSLVVARRRSSSLVVALTSAVACVAVSRKQTSSRRVVARPPSL